MGVSERLVEDFLKPTLLVGLFKPPEELSAAATIGAAKERTGESPWF